MSRSSAAPPSSRCAGSPRTPSLEGYVITSKVADLDKGQGFNAATGEYGDLVKGVIDPVKVTRSALENAASIASLLLTTETLVVEKPRRRPTPVTAATATPTSTARTVRTASGTPYRYA